MSKIALCIPAYNAAGYLPRLLQSAKKQFIQFNEVLVYNDCSTDNTTQVAESFGARVIQGDVNRGCSHGKNVLAGETNCDWIHFHDADDELLPNFTTLAHKWIAKHDCPDVVLFNYEYRDNDSNALLSIRHFDRQQLEADAVLYNINEQVNPFCGLYNKARFFAAGGYDTNPLILYNEDKAFHLRLAVNGLTFSAENQISVINYRLSSSMSAANVLKCARANYYVLKNIAGTHGNKYPLNIAVQLWKCIATLASRQDWLYVKKAIELSKSLGFNYSPADSIGFSLLTKINPYFGAWFREKIIRLLKPQFRNE